MIRKFPRRVAWLFCGLAVCAGGCFSVKAPEQINISGGSSRPEPVDSRRIPPTSSHEQARQELAKAYQNIQYLERENDKLRHKIDELKRKND